MAWREGALAKTLAGLYSPDDLDPDVLRGAIAALHARARHHPFEQIREHAAVHTTARGRGAAGNSIQVAGSSEISPRRRVAWRVAA